MSIKLAIPMVASVMMLATAAFAGTGPSFTLQVGAKGGAAPLNLISSTTNRPAAATCTNDKSPDALRPGGQDELFAQQSRSIASCKVSLGGAAQSGSYSKN
jgi:hypothetical protein